MPDRLNHCEHESAAILGAVALLEAGFRGDDDARFAFLRGDDVWLVAAGLEGLCTEFIHYIAEMTGYSADEVLSGWAAMVRKRYLEST